MRPLPAANPSPPPLPPPSPLLLAGAATHSKDEAEAEAVISVDSDTVVILASLLCALICVAGLALVARCTCRLRSRSSSSTTGGQAQEAPPCRAAAKRGLKKAAIEALPTMTMSASLESEAAECAICLAAFSEGDELRLLPHCAHAFHAACIDTWLAAHASCPSCRSTVLLTCRSCAAATVASHPLFAHDKEPSHEESTSSFT